MVSVSSEGLCSATRMSAKSFHDPWNDKMASVMRAGLAIGSMMDQ